MEMGNSIMKRFAARFSKSNPLAAEFLIKLSSFSFGPIIAAAIGFLSVPEISSRPIPPS